VLVLGLTFKENVPDLRNSRVIDIIEGLKRHGCAVDVHDAFADAAEAKSLYGIDLRPGLDGPQRFDCIVGAVPHAPYREFTPATFESLLRDGGLIADVKGMWRGMELPAKFRRWQL